MAKQVYNLSKEKVLLKFSTSPHGLSSEEVRARLKQYGKNAVKKRQNWSVLSILKNQFNDALVWILLVAASLAFAFGEYRDVTIIALIVGINALIGFLQEYKAEKTLEHIRQLTTENAVVVRSGKHVEIDARLLVPGDIMVLASGDTVPADGYLIEGYDVHANEYIFTGESKPGKKGVMVIEHENASLAEMDNMLFMGTSLTRGSAMVVVTGTGMRTELGKIAHLVTEVREDETPLQKQMRRLSRDVSILAVSIGILVMLLGQYYQVSLYENFLFALALAVSVVPEGLPAAISVALSLGMTRLLKKNVLAKKLNAVETLASVNIICTDKTGTITRNELMVTDIVCGREHIIVDGEGYQNVGNFYQGGALIDAKKILGMEELMRIATLCNEASLNQKHGVCSITGDPTEGALLVAAKKYEKNLKVFGEGLEKIAENPFSSERMRMSVVMREGKRGKITSLVKGSPDIIIGSCTHKLVDGKVSIFSKSEKEAVRRQYDELSRRALRVLAFAHRDVTEAAGKYKKEEDLLFEAEQKLVWVGMMGMIDPPRKDVANAVRECVESGIKVVMITGDYELTAGAIAKSVGLIKNDTAEVISGKKLDKMSDRKLWKTVASKEVVFARIAPVQKLRIATVLKSNGAVIAMTGDGVNDAPALKKADIGVAMGQIGTDVAKEASDMILLDDNFASIVRVIKEGRTIYQNLRKFVYYVFTSNVSEFFLVIIGVMLQVPAPIQAVQILAIDLGTDIFPSFSLSLEAAEPNIMKRKPFALNEKVINARSMWRLVRVGLMMAVGALVAFLLSMKRGGWEFGNKIDTNSVLYMRSTTVAYAVLSMTQMANLLQARSERLPVMVLGFFKNRFAIGAIVLSVVLLLCFMYVPVIAHSLRMMPIGILDWVAVMVMVVVVFFSEEVYKRFSQKREDMAQ